MPRTLNENGWNANYQNTAPVVSTQHFIALTNQYTMEVHGEAQLNNFTNLGLSHNVTWFNAFSTIRRIRAMWYLIYQGDIKYLAEPQ